MAGKGSRPRPLSIPKEKFDQNWDAIFGKSYDFSKAERGPIVVDGKLNPDKAVHKKLLDKHKETK